MTRLLCSIALLFLAKLVTVSSTGCNSENKRKSQDRSKILHWQTFFLQLEDTGAVSGNVISDSIVIGRIKGNPQSYYLGQMGRDSLVAWVSNLISYQTPDTVITCTDYVGKLSVGMRYSQTLVKRTEFSSICSWRRINEDTRKIDSLLKAVIR
jgi:hypothetical protein